jgi:hypothetical protein
MDAERDRVAAAEEAILARVMSANEAAVDRLRRDVIADPIRSYWDQRIAAAHRARAIAARV